MKYIYYPGCSLEGTACEYDISTRAFMREVGAELIEIEDWVCCGASAAEATSYLLSLVLPALNLAAAEATNEVQDILVPCSACYLNLKKVEEKTRKDPELLEKINIVLNENGRKLLGLKKVRHLLDVISRDVGTEGIRKRVRKTFPGLRIAPYYGCQCLRPYAVFDDPEAPRSMEPLIEATGAEVHPWDMGGKCCGASHMNTDMEVSLELVRAILQDAKGADAIVTVCPMCQMNLEAYQKKICTMYEEDLEMTVLYLPQFLGLSMGLSEQEVRLDLNLSVMSRFRDKLGGSDVVASAA
ncbi:CoB--CoM heterodisulfide reductase iron-sulfur subunit B family protein [Desulfonema magnum]|uniref:Cysteine-rich domain-containing protein n=1 Tax=Desulfonema magnum TaxID=45655 RepID=A0A975BYG8_9BACT|nr:CoB--CoM heterodisulfide reductase iron-sulfur subunit B family protein [Desulfonema magnum]QTA93968.1 Cysteine-rich domain-containing protein [Desulfonema magnum]